MNDNEILGYVRREAGLYGLAIEQDLTKLGKNTFRALSPFVVPVLDGVVGGIGRRAAKGRLGRLTSILLTLGIALGACSGMEDKPAPAPGASSDNPELSVNGQGGGGEQSESESQGGGEESQPIPSPTSVVIESGFGGLESEAQKVFAESTKAIGMRTAYVNYIEYLKRVGYFGSEAEKVITFVPICDSAAPDDPDKCTLVMEATGDPGFAGQVFTMPASQMARFQESGDINVLSSPQGDVLRDGTDPFRMTKQVTVGSVPHQAGIPEGAYLSWNVSEWVYMVGFGDEARVVGQLDEANKWEKVVTYPDSVADYTPENTPQMFEHGGYWWNQTVDAGGKTVWRAVNPDGTPVEGMERVTMQHVKGYFGRVEMFGMVHDFGKVKLVVSPRTPFMYDFTKKGVPMETLGNELWAKLKSDARDTNIIQAMNGGASVTVFLGSRDKADKLPFSPDGSFPFRQILDEETNQVLGELTCFSSDGNGIFTGPMIDGDGTVVVGVFYINARFEKLLETKSQSVDVMTDIHSPYVALGIPLRYINMYERYSAIKAEKPGADVVNDYAEWVRDNANIEWSE